MIVYDRSQLTVKASYQGKVSDKIVSNILNKTNNSSFEEILAHRDFTGKGLSQGDQFYISLKSDTQSIKEAFGFVPDSNEVFQSFIDDMLKLKNQLINSSLAEAYIVGEKVLEERFNKLRKRGNQNFTPISEFPLNLQSVLSNTISKPHDFQVLTKEQYEQFLLRSAQSHEFFVIANDFGYQITLLKSAK